MPAVLKAKEQEPPEKALVAAKQLSVHR